MWNYIYEYLIGRFDAERVMTRSEYRICQRIIQRHFTDFEFNTRLRRLEHWFFDKPVRDQLCKSKD